MGGEVLLELGDLGLEVVEFGLLILDGLVLLGDDFVLLGEAVLEVLSDLVDLGLVGGFEVLEGVLEGVNLGLVAMKLGNRERAQAEFQAALRIDPGNRVARQGLEKLAE